MSACQILRKWEKNQHFSFLCPLFSFSFFLFLSQNCILGLLSSWRCYECCLQTWPSKSGTVFVLNQDKPIMSHVLGQSVDITTAPSADLACPKHSYTHSCSPCNTNNSLKLNHDCEQGHFLMKSGSKVYYTSLKYHINFWYPYKITVYL